MFLDAKLVTRNCSNPQPSPDTRQQVPKGRNKLARHGAVPSSLLAGKREWRVGTKTGLKPRRGGSLKNQLHHHTFQHIHIPQIITWFVDRRLRDERCILHSRVIDQLTECLYSDRPLTDMLMTVQL